MFNQNKLRIPKQHRRYSLPGTSTLAPFGFHRSFPEGSDIFQKAFEDLSINEPNHARKSFASNGSFNGLSNIEEDDECEEDKTVETVVFTDQCCNNRRHSSPSCFQGQGGTDSTDSSKKTKTKVKEIDDVLENHKNFRKEYFKKHGRWPTASSVTSAAKKRPSSYVKVKSN